MVGAGGPVGTSRGAQSGPKPPQEPWPVVGWPHHQVAGLLYTDALARAFAWQWLEVSEDAKSARGQGGVEASMGSFRSRAEASQLGTGLPLRAWLQGHLGLLERASRLQSGIWPESAPWSREG